VGDLSELQIPTKYVLYKTRLNWGLGFVFWNLLSCGLSNTIKSKKMKTVRFLPV